MRQIVLDTETTGLDLREARIVTACVVELGADGNGLVLADGDRQQHAQRRI